MAVDATGYDEAIDAFASRVETANMASLQRLVLFGSVARGTHDPDSDVDVLAIVDDSADVAAVEDRLREIAYDVMLEHGPAFSIHAVTATTLEDRSTHPFFRSVLEDGHAIYG